MEGVRLIHYEQPQFDRIPIEAKGQRSVTMSGISFSEISDFHNSNTHYNYGEAEEFGQI